MERAIELSNTNQVHFGSDPLYFQATGLLAVEYRRSNPAPIDLSPDQTVNEQEAFLLGDFDLVEDDDQYEDQLPEAGAGEVWDPKEIASRIRTLIKEAVGLVEI